MIFDIRYLTEYRYASSVVDNMNALRVKPARTPTQQPSGFVVMISPETRTQEHLDYFGTTVHEFEVLRPHASLAIDVAVRCAVSPPDAVADIGWDAIATQAYRDLGADFLMAHEAARSHPTLDRLAGEARADGPLATALRLCDLIPESFEYRKGVTYVGSTVADLLAAGAGVCQDFVHVTLAILRGLGVAARYCSGYLFAADGEEGRSVEVDTHAWLEVMVPNGTGMTWVGFDPTNAVQVADRHVKIGHGRWYSDVPPIRGVFRGPAGGELSANVTMTAVG